MLFESFTRRFLSKLRIILFNKVEMFCEKIEILQQWNESLDPLLQNLKLGYNYDAEKMKTDLKA